MDDLKFKDMALMRMKANSIEAMFRILVKFTIVTPNPNNRKARVYLSQKDYNNLLLYWTGNL